LIHYLTSYPGSCHFDGDILHLNHIYNNCQPHRNRGQAMTEFIISASFFLVPLFLGISVIAKYIDIKQANVQAARYQAWEYTVWFANDTERGIDYSSGKINNGGEVMSGFDAVKQPVKTTAQTRNESKQRFYTNPGNEDTTAPILATDATTGWTTASANPLWTDHTGLPLYSGVDGGNASLSSSEETPTLPVVGDIMNVLLKAIGFIFGAMGDLMSLVGSAVGFNAINTDGYAMSNESMEVAFNPRFRDISGRDLSLTVGTDSTATTRDFVSTAAVLSDAWNAGGAEHTYNQAGGTVPTTLLNGLLDAIPGFKDIWNIVSILAPELRLCNPGGIWGADDKGSLWLGHIDIDAVHPDRLQDPDTGDPGGTHECNDAGMCDFVPVVPRTEDSRYCIN